MLSLLAADAHGSRHWAYTAMAHDFREHPCTQEWEGLDSMDVPEKEAQDDDNPTAKAPSRFPEEWMNGEHGGMNEYSSDSESDHASDAASESA